MDMSVYVLLWLSVLAPHSVLNSNGKVQRVVEDAELSSQGIISGSDDGPVSEAVEDEPTTRTDEGKNDLLKRDPITLRPSDENLVRKETEEKSVQEKWNVNIITDELISEPNIVSTSEIKPAGENHDESQGEDMDPPARAAEFNKDADATSQVVAPVPDIEQSSDGVVGTTERVLLVSLGGGEDELFIAGAAQLLASRGHDVVVLVYGATREIPFPKTVKIIEIPVTRDDPLLATGVSGGDGVGSREWAAGSIVWSRVVACSGLSAVEDQVSALKPAVLITPLWLHDVCTLALASRLGVPAIGVITSRVGAWWAWAQLGALPDLASASAPTGSVGDGGLYARASNLAQHYAFMSTMRQRWQAPAVSSLPHDWEQANLPSLYRGLHRLLVVWDPALHPCPPHTPSAVPIGGFAADLTPITKDVLVPALLNRAGILVVSPGGREVWLGGSVTSALYRALAPLPYTVIWSAPHQHLRPNDSNGEAAPGGTGGVSEQTAAGVMAKFIYKENIPLNGVLGHPRHRLLVSTCGEADVAAAAHFASPVLCLPVTTDQLLAAQHLSHLGVAEVVPAWEATQETIERALRVLFKDRRYRTKARSLAEDLHDQPLSPADRLLYHVQHTIRHPHSTRYAISGSDLSLLQQGNADVFLLLLLAFTVLAGLVLTAVLMLGPALLKRTKRKAD